MVSGNNGIENIKSNDIIPYRMTNTKLIYYIHIICISNTIYIYISRIVISPSVLIHILNEINNFNTFV